MDKVEQIKQEIEGWDTEDLQDLGGFIESIINARIEEGEKIYE